MTPESGKTVTLLPKHLSKALFHILTDDHSNMVFGRHGTLGTL